MVAIISTAWNSLSVVGEAEDIVSNTMGRFRGVVSVVKEWVVEWSLVRLFP